MDPFSVVGSTITVDKIVVGIIVGAIVSVVLNVVVFFAARALGTTIQIARPPSMTEVQNLPLPLVIGASSVPAIVAGILLFIIAQIASQPVPIFVLIAVVVDIASLLSPWRLPVSLQSRYALIVMHILAGVAITGGLLWAVSR